MTPIISWEDGFDRMRLELIPNAYADLPKQRRVELPAAYLARLQRYIRRIYGPDDLCSHGVLMFGLVFGDTLVRNLDGAEWQHPAYAPNADGSYTFDFADHHVRYRGVMVKPFVRMQKWWRDRADCLVSMFTGVEQLGEMTEAEVVNIPRGRWLAMPDGVLLRLPKGESNAS